MHAPINPPLPPLDRARRVLAIEQQALARTAARLTDAFPAAVQLLRETIENDGKIIILGVGKSGHIGEKIAATFSSTGAPAVMLNSLNALHGDLGIVRQRDCLLTLSQSGETDELLQILPAIRREGAPIIALTGRLDSTLAKLATHVLDTSVEQEACPLNLAPTASTTVMLALGDALAMTLLEQRGFTPDQFARYHPGGHLGKRLLLRVTDLMRPLDQIASVLPTTTVADTVHAMNHHRCGAALVCDPSGALVGIFTHGDFLRAYERDPLIGQHPVENAMTPQPVSIPAAALAVDLLRLLETRRVDDIVVIDPLNHPVGLIDSQDLARHKIW